jgi:protein ImuA
VDKAAQAPLSSARRSAWICTRQTVEDSGGERKRVRTSGGSDHPLALPFASAGDRKALIEDLRVRVEALERCLEVGSPTRSTPPGAGEVAVCVTPPSEDDSAFPRMPPVHALSSSPPLQAGKVAWTFGAPDIDRLLPDRGLRAAGLHEVKPAAYGDWPAALALGLMLAVRRLDAIEAANSAKVSVLWCWTAARARDLGRLYAPGLSALGLQPGSILVVEAGNETDALWAMEEGLKARSVALVVGCIDDVKLTPARRLSLAAEAHGTPCLIATDPRASGAAAAATRWRIARAASGLHPFDPAAPGRPRFRLTLERARGVPILDDHSFCVEWRNDTHRFGLAAGLADRADAAAYAGQRAGRPSVRAR